MKTRVLIIDDNCYKVFTTKQVLKSLLKIDVQEMGAGTDSELVQRTDEFNPDMIIFNTGGVVDLLSRMKKRNSNRRNTEIALMMVAEMDSESSKRVRQFLADYPKRAEIECKAA
jgi:response regulator RpfG family c-di-GMP phosphodiesterase